MSSNEAKWGGEFQGRTPIEVDGFGARDLPPFDAPPAPRGYPWPAWCAIFIMIAIQQVSAFFVDEAKLKSFLAEGGSIIGQIEGRLLVGIRQLGEDLGGDFKEEFQEKIQTNLSPHQGPVTQRLQAIAIVGELSGTTEALSNLFKLRESIEKADHQLTEEESRLLALCERIYRKIAGKEDPAKGLAEDERQLVTQQLGWCGRLMLSPDKLSPVDRREGVIGPAKRFAAMILIGMGLGILGVGLGFILGLILTVMFASRSLSFGLPAQSRAGNAGASGVYLEAFAVWMGTFQVGSLLIARLPLQNALIAALGINMLGAMGVGILWAVVRGIPWSVLREDLGWHLGRGLFIEPWCGLMGYLATLPLLIVGVVLMLILSSLAGAVFPQEAVSDPFAPLEVPMHPIVSWVADGNRGVLLQLGLMACVVAPFVEETLFRGFLLRYLRDASRWTGVGVSFLFSVLFNSLIFAAIHPQGPIAIPVLMAIACGLSILREWRGSLLGPMVAHGLNNSIVMAILFGAVW